MSNLGEGDHARFLERLAQEEPRDIFGLVNAMGVGGMQMFDEPLSLNLTLSAWKEPNGSLRKEDLYLSMSVSDEDVKRHSAAISPYSILHLRAQIGRGPNGRMRGHLKEIVSTAHSDPELAAAADEQQNPAIVEDKDFGTLVLNRRTRQFEGTAAWQDKKVTIYLYAVSEEELGPLLLTARALWSNQAEWAHKIGIVALEQLLNLKNQSWLEEDEEAVSPHEFLKRMILRSITIADGGEFEFKHDDSDLFWGHRIEVSGNLETGPIHASI